MPRQKSTSMLSSATRDVVELIPNSYEINKLQRSAKKNYAQLHSASQFS